MKVLHIVPTFYPATYWGGPIHSTKAICDGLAASAGARVRVLTTDAAGPSLRQRVVPAPLPYPVHYAARIAGHSVAPGLLARLPRAIAWADIVHLTGVYNTPSLPALLLCRMLGKPLVWSPRGALQATESWDDVPRRRAKRAFQAVAAACLPRDAVIHATSAPEAAVAARLFPLQSHRIIPNAVDIPTLDKAPPRAGGLRLMFLGRLHPKKGLDLLLGAMRDLPEDTRLDIYGDGPAAYVFAVRQIAKAIGRDIRFHGHVEGPAKARAFAQADLFVLPSYSENFGIAVAEALAHGVPVLTTDATPWQDVVRHQCGRIITLGLDDLAGAISEMAHADLAAMGARGRGWMRRDFGPAAMVARFAALYAERAVAENRMVPA